MSFYLLGDAVELTLYCFIDFIGFLGLYRLHMFLFTPQNLHFFFMSDKTILQNLNSFQFIIDKRLHILFLIKCLWALQTCLFAHLNFWLRAQYFKVIFWLSRLVTRYFIHRTHFVIGKFLLSFRFVISASLLPIRFVFFKFFKERLSNAVF